MAKRGADSYLTDRNWDEEDEKEEAGSFVPASEDVIRGREIKKAKRRVDGDAPSSTTGAFKGFAGFGTMGKPASSSFSFGTLNSGSSTSQSNGAAKSSVTAIPPPAFSFGNTSNATSTTTVKALGSATTAPKLSNGTSKSPSNKSKYLTQLKTLNEGVMKWIKQHVDANPYCILTPIFTDYEKYLKEIEKKYPYKEKQEEKLSAEKVDSKPEKKEEAKEAAAKTTAVTTAASAVTTGASGTFTATTSAFAAPAPAGGASSGIFGTGATTSGFTFGSAVSSTTTTTTATSTFSFSKDSTGGSTTKPAVTGFGFGSTGSMPGATSGFTFASAKPGADKPSEDKAAAEEEEYVPPKEEVKTVKEDDAYYTKRCKLFFKKDGNWTEKGVGNLYLKDCDGKTQLLVRADTNLGNILLNIMVTSSIPASRQGKNNVTIICIPNPPLKEKDADEKTPVSMLIRVKTAEDANELFEKIQAAKNK